MNTKYESDKIRIRRSCVDMWNAFKVRGATFTDNDIPYSPTTALEIPTSLVSYPSAVTLGLSSLIFELSGGILMKISEAIIPYEGIESIKPHQKIDIANCRLHLSRRSLVC